MTEEIGTTTTKLKKEGKESTYNISFNISTKEYRKNKVSSLKFENVNGN